MIAKNNINGKGIKELSVCHVKMDTSQQLHQKELGENFSFLKLHTPKIEL